MSPQKSPTGRSILPQAGDKIFFPAWSINSRPSVVARLAQITSRLSTASFTSAGPRVRQKAAAGFDNIWHFLSFRISIFSIFSSPPSSLSPSLKPSFACFIAILCELERARRSAALWIRSASFWLHHHHRRRFHRPSLLSCRHSAGSRVRL